MGAVLEGLKSIKKYQKKYKIDISNRDSIKIFAFSIPHINRSIESLRDDGFDMSDSTAYFACMEFIANSYKNKSVDFTNHPDLKNTCRILSELASNESELAGYTYLKGVQETCICTS